MQPVPEVLYGCRWGVGGCRPGCADGVRCGASMVYANAIRPLAGRPPRISSNDRRQVDVALGAVSVIVDALTLPRISNLNEGRDATRTVKGRGRR
jgi:hypothetical protein